MSLNRESTTGTTQMRGAIGSWITAHSNQSNNQANATDRPTAQFWANLGYPADVEDDNGDTVTRFISLAQGIPLDTLPTLSTKGSSRMFREMRAAQNHLAEQLLDIAKPLAPEGELLYPVGDTGLYLQIRRVKAADEEIKVSENRLAKRLHFA